MKRNWFKLPFWASLLMGIVTAFSVFRGTLVLAQQLTPAPTDVFITVTYSEQINVRSGPSTILYDIIGNMQPGETASALGVSPGRDWVKIAFPAGPGGTGWVHTSLISISSGNLQVLEPPPTSTPLITPTIDPTLMAAFNLQPTSTRLPTFTPPPPLVIPSFTETPEKNQAPNYPMGAIALALGIPGLAGFLLSSFFRRR
ncbi:MAG: SH3 domain-containing protein [Chloroflexota bacterium]